jgi:two-component system chemotaxis response regulator CheB
LNHERGRVAAKGGVVEVVDAVGAGDGPGQISGITCPECHGSLWVRSEQGALTYECRIGHALSPDTLYDLQAENVEQALWAGVRALEEQASLSRFMAEGARRRGDEEPADRYDNRRRRAEANAESLRRLLMDRD